MPSGEIGFTLAGKTRGCTLTTTAAANFEGPKSLGNAKLGNLAAPEGEFTGYVAIMRSRRVIRSFDEVTAKDKRTTVPCVLCVQNSGSPSAPATQDADYSKNPSQRRALHSEAGNLDVQVSPFGFDILGIRFMPGPFVSGSALRQGARSKFLMVCLMFIRSSERPAAPLGRRLVRSAG